MKSVAIVALLAVALFVTTEANFLECQMCEMSVKIVVPMLGQDTKNIENAVNKECTKEFHSIPFASHECKKFIDAKLDPIINELENGTAPKDVCTKLHMC